MYVTFTDVTKVFGGLSQISVACVLTPALLGYVFAPLHAETCLLPKDKTILRKVFDVGILLADDAVVTDGPLLSGL